MKIRLVAAFAFAFASGSALGANQTVDFSGAVIPNGGISSTLDWDGYHVDISGGFQPYLQLSPLKFATVSPGDNITVKITRIDGADFVAVSANVSNSDENISMVVAGYNNNALVGGTTTTVAANQSNQNANLGSATVDEIRITAQTNASFSIAGYLNNFVVSVASLPPTLTSFTGTLNYPIGGTAMTLDTSTAATLSDPDSTDFNGGSVRVTGYIGEASTQDVLQVGNVGTIALDLGTGNVSDSGTVIGQVSSNGQAGADLVINLNASATVARVQNLVRALQYFNSEPASPFIHSRTLLTSVSDGDGAPPRVYSTTVNFSLLADPANTQKVTFNSATTVPDITAGIATSFTSQGFTFAISGGSGAYLQAGGTFPGSPGCNMGTTGGGTITLTVNRPAGADFSLDGFVLGNSTSQNVSVDLRLNGSSIATRTLPASFAQRMDFAGLTVDEIRVSGNSSASGFFQAGTFDELIYYPSNLSPAIGNLQGDSVAFTQAGSAVALDSGTAATLSDVDSANFDTGSLRVAIVQNEWAAQDVLQVGNVGTITVSGSNVSDSGTQFGTITSNGSGGNDLLVSFNAQSTNARVQNLLRALQYRNTENTLPDLGNRSVLITVIDGDASSPAEISTIVRVAPSALPAGRVVTLDYTGIASQPVNTTQVDFQNYRMTISGGFQRYLQNGFDGPAPPGIYGADTGISSLTMSLARIDGADFRAHSVIVHNHNGAVAMTVKSRNNGSDVQTLTLPAGATQRLLFTDTNLVDQITFAGSNSAVNGLLAYVDELAVVPPNTPPTISMTATALAYTENAAATPVDSAANVVDPDNNWNGGTLVAQITSNAGATDQLGVISAGTASLSGLNVQVSGVTKGTVNAATVSLGNALTITFNATATTADVQAVARAIAYTNLSDNPSVSTRTVTFTVTDAALTTANGTRQITVAAVSDVPTLANASVLTYTENQAAVAINTTVTVADPDSANLGAGTVSISSGFVSGQDVLGFTAVPGTMGNIAGVYTPGTGVMALTSSGSTATLAQWQAALRAVTYSNTSENPSASARTVSFVVNDGGNSNTLNSTINITAVNDAPVLSNGSVLAYTENQAATAVNTSITTADLDSATFASGTVSIGAGFVSGQDVLGFVNVPASMGNIVGVYTPATGVMALTSSGSTATLAQWQAALRAVTYANSSENPNTGARTVSFLVNDGSSSNTVSSTINLTASNDPPTLAGTSALAYTENQAATPINSAIVAVDVDNVALGAGSVSIASNFVVAEDVLTFTAIPATMGNITGSYTAATGVMTLTSAGSTATVAQWQAALRAVGYSNTSEDPTGSARGVDFVVSDGSNSNTVTSTITVTSVNDAPVLTNSSVLAYTENQATALINTSITVADIDSASLAAASISIGANFAVGQDVLDFTPVPATMGNITGSYSAASGVMTLTSSGATATLAQWQAALRAVGYANTSDDPVTAARSVSYVVNDGGNSNAVTSTIDLTAVNDAPELTVPSSLTYTENQSATPINTAITVTDVDDATLGSASVAITANLAIAEDELSFTNIPASMGNISGSYSPATGVMVLTSAAATATLAQWQSALRAVRYANSSEDPTPGVRTVAFVVNDSGSSNALESTIAVTSVNDPPTLTGASVLGYAENQAATPINTAIAVDDVDNATLGTASVSITANFNPAEDVLAFTSVPASMGDISGVYSAASGEMLLASAGAGATLAQWQSALQAITYENTSDNPDIGARTVAFVISDGSNSNTLTSTINLTASNDPPQLTGASALDYAENQAATVINATLNVADLDHSTLESGSVSITTNLVPAEDVLSFDNVPASMGNISGVFDANTGNMALTSAGATATLAQWQAALRAVRYANSSDSPSTATRSVAFAVHDGGAGSNIVTSDIDVSAINDAPVVTLQSGMQMLEDATSLLGNIDVGDVDSGNSDLSIALSVPSGILDANGDANVQVTGAPGASIQATGSASELDAWLSGGGVIAYTPGANINGDVLLTVLSSDNGATPGPAATDSDQVLISIIPVADAEVVASISDGLGYVTVGDTAVYTARIRNQGAEPIELSQNAYAEFAIPNGLTDVLWSCVGVRGGSCTASGTGAIHDPVVLPAGGVVTYMIGGVVAAGDTPTLDAVFAITASPTLQGDDPGDNTAMDSNEIRLFQDGFE